VKTGITVTAGQTSYVNFWLEVQPTLMGQVTDESGSPVIGATVTAGDYTAATQPPYGVYQFGPELPHDDYAVTASAVGYRHFTNYYVNASDPNKTAYCNFKLQRCGFLKGQVNDAATHLPLVDAIVEVRSGDYVRQLPAVLLRGVTRPLRYEGRAVAVGRQSSQAEDSDTSRTQRPT
jgi:hypothetical protein